MIGCLPTDDFASDPYDNVKFYRCANGYQYVSQLFNIVNKKNPIPRF